MSYTKQDKDYQTCACTTHIVDNHIENIACQEIEDMSKLDVVNTDNYIDWITYGAKQNSEYTSNTFHWKKNNDDFSVTPQENTFTNKNQSNIDTLAATAKREIEKGSRNPNFIKKIKSNFDDEYHNKLLEAYKSLNGGTNTKSSNITQEDINYWCNHHLAQIDERSPVGNTEDSSDYVEIYDDKENIYQISNLKKHVKENDDDDEVIHEEVRQIIPMNTDKKEPSDNMRKSKPKKKKYDYNLYLPEVKKVNDTLIKHKECPSDNMRNKIKKYNDQQLSITSNAVNINYLYQPTENGQRTTNNKNGEKTLKIVDGRGAWSISYN